MTNSNGKNLVVLIDANNTLYRMYHTQPPRLFNGHRVESAQGLIGNVRRFAEGSITGNVAATIMVCDANSPNFRHALSEDYKKERKGMPEDLRPQEEIAKEAARAMGIPVLEIHGYEADDTLGMVANYYVSQGYDVMIETTDKDMAQLVSDKITTYNPSTKQRFTPAGVKEKFGVGPDGIVDYLAIMGDKSDGIIGIDKVGPKTAVKWLEAYGSLEGVMANANEIKGKVGENLREGLNRLSLNQKLTTIHADPALLSQDDLNILNNTSPNMAEAKRILETYGIKAHAVGEIEARGPSSANTAPTKPVVKPDPDEGFSQGSLF